MKRIIYTLLALISALALAGCKTRYITQEAEAEEKALRHDTVTVVKFQTVTRHDTVREITHEVASTVTERFDTLGRIVARQTASRAKDAERSSRGSWQAATASRATQSTATRQEARRHDRIVERQKPWRERALESLGLVFLATLLAAVCWAAWRLRLLFRK